MKQRIKKIIAGCFILFFLILIIVVGIIRKKFYSSAFIPDQIDYLYIDDRKDYDNLLLQLKSKGIKDIHFFNRFASKMNYPESMKTGKYKIDPAMNYVELIKMLRNGYQVPVKLTFNNIRLKTDLTERISTQLMLDSSTLLNCLNDPVKTASWGFNPETVLAMFIPNTYEIYWNISVDKFLEKMKKEYDRFWIKERLDKAENIHLSPVEISILASIVEEETARKAEFPVVAGLYLNRLRKGMRLQADPTVKFAVGDLTLKRILIDHLSVDSPYNTYIYSGLPPGLIRLPSIAAIDAVLNYKEHSYLYMCAKEDFSGEHNFAVTFSEHNRNARKYQSALNRNHIR